METRTFVIGVAAGIVLAAVILEISCLFPPKHPHEIVYPAGSLDADKCGAVIRGIDKYESANGQVPQLYKIVRRDGPNGSSLPTRGTLNDLFLEDAVNQNPQPTPGGCAVQVGIGLTGAPSDKCLFQPNTTAVHSHLMNAIAQSKDLVKAVQDELAKLNQPPPPPTP